MYDHSNFKPQLESSKNKILMKDVYLPGASNKVEDLVGSVQEFLTKKGSYKHVNQRLCDYFERKPKEAKIKVQSRRRN